MNKRAIVLLFALLLVLNFVLCGCDENETSSSSGDGFNLSDSESTHPDKSDEPSDTHSSSVNSNVSISDSSEESSGTTAKLTYSYSIKSSDKLVEWDDKIASHISFNGSSIVCSGENVTVAENVAVISAGGLYVVSGKLDNGQIYVNSSDNEDVRIILNGTDIYCADSSAIYVANAEKVIITLADGTNNTLADGKQYVYDDTVNQEPSATLFSKDDLTINGSGTLNINASFNNGIQTKDKLKILGGTLNVSAVNNAIKGKDCVVILDSNIKINSDEDAIQSSNSTEADKGFVCIENTVLDIVSGRDGIQAETGVKIISGTLRIKSGGGSTAGTVSQRPGSAASSGSKGIKASVDVTVLGGNIDIDSSDDAFHCNGTMNIGGGNITIKTNDDALHSDEVLTIDGGKITVERSYEGLEASTININDGEIRITANDDALNAAGKGSSNGGMMRPGQQSGTASNFIYINGGYLWLTSSGDGIDSNGAITMTGGTVIANGPTSNGNGTLDFDHSFVIKGGVLLAAGSSGMLQTPSASSTQYSFSAGVNISQGEVVRVVDGNGETVIAFKTLKSIQNITFSSPSLKEGSEYKIYTGGTYENGTETDNCINNATFSSGTEALSFKISGIVTSVGNSGGMGGPGGGGHGGGPTRPGRPGWF